MSQAQTYVDHIRRHATSRPTAVALDWDCGRLTYAAFAERVERLAGELVRSGVRRGEPVGLRTRRGPGLVVGMAAISRSGGVIVPMAPEEPSHRLEQIAADCGARMVVLSADGLRPPNRLSGIRVDDSGAVCEPGAAPSVQYPDMGFRDGAYLLYTSGSTGVPKGVLVEHGGLINYLTWCVETILDPGCPMPATASIAFDAVLKQTLGPLFGGAAAWLVSDDVATSPGELSRLLINSGPCSLNCVPSLWRAVLLELELAKENSEIPLRRLLLGGEPVDTQLLTRSRALIPDVEMWNLYGPTEATANATAGILARRSETVLGRPLRQTAVYVRGSDGGDVPEGGTGELYIGGTGVARGYLGRPAQTAERFVPDPSSIVPGARMFRTGDVVRRLSGGELEFVGRRDRQVKRSGVRIELAEVDESVRRIPGATDAVAFMSGTDESLLVTVVEAPDGTQISGSQVRREVAAWSRKPAVPDIVRVVAQLPRTPGGKVDVSELRQSTAVEVGSNDFAADAVESVLAEVWAQVLERDQVGRRDDFFELGGHSLAMLRIVGRVGELLDFDLPMDIFFDAPTISEHAAFIRTKLGESADAKAAAVVHKQAGADPALLGAE